MNKQTLVSLVVEYDAALGDVYWHVVSANLRSGDLCYELVGAQPKRRQLFDAYWTRFMLKRVVMHRLRRYIRHTPTTRFRPPSPEEVSRWQDILERD